MSDDRLLTFAAALAADDGMKDSEKVRWLAIVCRHYEAKIDGLVEAIEFVQNECDHVGPPLGAPLTDDAQTVVRCVDALNRIEALATEALRQYHEGDVR